MAERSPTKILRTVCQHSDGKQGVVVPIAALREAHSIPDSDLQGTLRSLARGNLIAVEEEGGTIMRVRLTEAGATECRREEYTTPSSAL
jgi:hypothetical protein